MSSLSSGDHTIRSDYHVTVEVYVHLERCQHYVVQLVYYSALVERVRVNSSRDPVVVHVLKALYRVEVEVLYVEHDISHAVFEELAHCLC